MVPFAYETPVSTTKRAATAVAHSRWTGQQAAGVRGCRCRRRVYWAWALWSKRWLTKWSSWLVSKGLVPPVEDSEGPLQASDHGEVLHVQRKQVVSECVRCSRDDVVDDVNARVGAAEPSKELGSAS